MADSNGSPVAAKPGRGNFAKQNCKKSTQSKLEKANNGDLGAAFALGWGRTKITAMYNNKMGRVAYTPIDDQELLDRLDTREAKARKASANYNARKRARQQQDIIPSAQPEQYPMPQTAQDTALQAAHAKIAEIEQQREEAIDRVARATQAKLVQLSKEQEKLSADVDKEAQARIDEIKALFYQNHPGTSPRDYPFDAEEEEEDEFDGEGVEGGEVNGGAIEYEDDEEEDADEMRP